MLADLWGFPQQMSSPLPGSYSASPNGGQETNFSEKKNDDYTRQILQLQDSFMKSVGSKVFSHGNYLSQTMTENFRKIKSAMDLMSQELDSAKQDIRSNRSEINKLLQYTFSLETEISSLCDKTERMDRVNREVNVKFTGMYEPEDEDGYDDTMQS